MESKRGGSNDRLRIGILLYRVLKGYDRLMIFMWIVEFFEIL